MRRSGPVDMPQARALLIMAQVFITLTMTFLMTGIFTALPERLAPGWVGLWLSRWAVTWPVAFLLSLVVSPAAFRLAALVLRVTTRRRADAL